MAHLCLFFLLLLFTTFECSQLASSRWQTCKSKVHSCMLFISQTGIYLPSLLSGVPTFVSCLLRTSIATTSKTGVLNWGPCLSTVTFWLGPWKLIHSFEVKKGLGCKSSLSTYWLCDLGQATLTEPSYTWHFLTTASFTGWVKEIQRLGNNVSEGSRMPGACWLSKECALSFGLSEPLIQNSMNTGKWRHCVSPFTKEKQSRRCSKYMPRAY